MNTLHYITRDDLKSRIDEIIDDILQNDSEYYLMIDNEPRVKIGPITDKDGKKVFIAEEEKKKLKKFVE